MQNIEIEIKIAIDKQIYSTCKEFLCKHAQFIKEDREVDQYFNSSRRNFVALEYPYEWVRVRTKNTRVTLNYKHWHPKNSSISTHCDEFETDVSDQEALVKILKALGVKLLVIVDKHREKYIYGNQFEVSLDYVRELGFFVEIEYVGKDISILEAQGRINEFAKELNLDLSRRDNRGYPYLMLDKMGFLKKYRNDKQSRQAILNLF